MKRRILKYGSIYHQTKNITNNVEFTSSNGLQTYSQNMSCESIKGANKTLEMNWQLLGNYRFTRKRK